VWVVNNVIMKTGSVRSVIGVITKAENICNECRECAVGLDLFIGYYGLAFMGYWSITQVIM
jgi:hypothetical protein